MRFGNFLRAAAFIAIGLLAVQTRAADSTPAGVAFVSSQNPSTFGQAVFLTATVSPPTGSGIITFFDGTTVLGSAKLNKGQASLTTSLLAAGTRPLRAYYNGDANYMPGTSPTLAQVVRPLSANGFREPPGPASSPPPSPLAIGDFNGDGIADLVTGTDLALGNGDGTFQPPGRIDLGPNTLIYGLSVAAADLNGDGKTDFLVVGYFENYVNPGLIVVLGNGDGTFQPPMFFGMFYRPVLLTLGDFNADGKIDVAVGDAGRGPDSSSISVLLGNGDGSFQPATMVDSGNIPQALVVGDFNGDGIVDLAIAVAGTSRVFILPGNGDGTFQSAANYDAAGPAMALVAEDFNGDGNTDLAAALDDGTVRVFLSGRDGTLQGPVSYQAGAAYPYFKPIGMAVGDFDGDGNPDLAVANPFGIAVLLGNGNGTFQQPRYYGGAGESIVIADFNGDGRSDIATDNGNVLLGELTSIPSISPVGVLNAAGPNGGFLTTANVQYVSPGSLARVYGNFQLNPPVAAMGLAAAGDLDGPSLIFDGALAAPVIDASAGQVTFQIPWELAGQSQTSLTVTVKGRASDPQIVKLLSSAPGIFAGNGEGSGQGAIFDLSNRLVDGSNPAAAGDTVVIYSTGLGPVSNQPATGFPASGSPLSLATLPFRVGIGIDYANVVFAGLAPGLVGVYQINAVVPSSTSPYSRGPTVGVIITTGINVFSTFKSNTITIAVQ
jgi:uncharacterized protein (TIGR03437 family)